MLLATFNYRTELLNLAAPNKTHRHTYSLTHASIQNKKKKKKKKEMFKKISNTIRPGYNELMDSMLFLLPFGIKLIIGFVLIFRSREPVYVDYVSIRFDCPSNISVTIHLALNESKRREAKIWFRDFKLHVIIFLLLLLLLSLFNFNFEFNRNTCVRDGL